MKWCVYYGDGAKFSDKDGGPELVPARDVQVIAQVSKEHGWEAVAGNDYYIWRDGRWYGVDKFGLFDYLVDPGWKRVLFGRMLTKDEYNAVWAQVSQDMPDKTAFEKWERKP